MDVLAESGNENWIWTKNTEQTQHHKSNAPAEMETPIFKKKTWNAKLQNNTPLPSRNTFFGSLEKRINSKTCFLKFSNKGY